MDLLCHRAQFPGATAQHQPVKTGEASNFTPNFSCPNVDSQMNCWLSLPRKVKVEMRRNLAGARYQWGIQKFELMDRRLNYPISDMASYIIYNYNNYNNGLYHGYMDLLYIYYMYNGYVMVYTLRLIEIYNGLYHSHWNMDHKKGIYNWIYCVKRDILLWRWYHRIERIYLWPIEIQDATLAGGFLPAQQLKSGLQMGINHQRVSLNWSRIC